MRPVTTRLSTPIMAFLTAWAMVLTPLLPTAQPALAAATITVTTTAQGVNDDADCSLQEAIFAANLDASSAPDPTKLDDPNAFITTGCVAGNGADIIVLPAMANFTMSGSVADVANYLGPTATPMVTSTITIEANGSTLQHGGTSLYRAFAVGSGGDLTLHEIHVTGFEVHGGNGTDGGGGGMGAGGAVYVHAGTLSVGWSTFDQNGAVGGDGGGTRDQADIGGWDVGGGGGGIGGDGGEARLGGGGGGGAGRSGGSGNRITCNPPPGELCEFGFGGGGGGTARNGSNASTGNASGGLDCGGAGAGTQTGDSGHDATCMGGGGGGGNSGLINTDGGVLQLLQTEGGNGGAGGYGGGGGGGGWGSTAVLSSGTDGGHGGFGGGGGGAGGTQSSGGDGGFGGGGGGGIEGSLNIGGIGQGGTFAGDGGGNYGGGGAGLGGAIFGHQATIVIRNSTFAGNFANRGHYGGGNANDGRGAGGAVFLVAGALFINNSTFSNNQTGEFTTGIGGLGGGGIVVYKPTTNEATSLTLRNSILAGNGVHECYLRNGASAAGVGNLIVDNSVNTHGDAPCPGVATSDDPQLGALALNDPGRTPTMRILATSPAADAADAATAEPDDQRGILRPQGAADDIGAFEVGGQPPVTTVVLTPATSDGANGWYVNTVGVTVSATDVDSSIGQTRCAVDPVTAPTSFAELPDAACNLTSVSADGEHTIYAASVDVDGNVEATLAQASLKLDATPPTLSPTLNTATVLVGQAGVVASPNASDATSGVANQSCEAVDTATPGVKSLDCSAQDNAGNSATVQLTYVVEYRILGFFSPVPMSKWRVGTTVPIKVALGDADGNRISSAEAAELAAACRVTFAASGAQAKSGACLKYDRRHDQFIYNWRLAKQGTGLATISVSVSYPGTALATTLSAEIEIMP